MAKKKIPGKPGRPSRFNVALAEQILELAKEGLTDEQIAAKVGIARQTLAIWKSKHKSFGDALKEGKDIADDLVEASLFRMAIGYSHPSVKFFFDGKKGEVVSQRYLEQYQPNTTAAIFWLKNRRPNLWRDVHKIDVEGEVSVSLTREEAIRVLTADFAVLPPNDPEEGQEEP